MLSTKEIMKMLKTFGEQVKRRSALMFGRGIITNVDDSGALQTNDIELLAGELRSQIETLKHYGFTYVVPEGVSEHLTAFMGGNRDHGVVIATQHRASRPKDLARGEVMLYTDEGDFLRFKRDNTIELFSKKKFVANITDDVEINTKRVIINASEKFTLNTPEFEANTTNTVINASAKFTAAAPDCAISSVSVVGGQMDVPDGVKIAGLEHRTHGHQQGDDNNGDSEVKTDGPT